MDFESLPTEIFLDLFDYFDGTDLLHTFYVLNSRFNQLLDEQYRTFHFNFRSTSKRQFDMICQQHLPIIADRVIALSFSDLDNIPEQIGVFFSYIPLLDVFHHLRSLSLSDIDEHETTMKIIDQCHSLCHLRCFTVHFGYFNDSYKQFESMIDNIWSLSKLVHCEMNFSESTRGFFHTPTNISSSLERFSLNGPMISFHQLNQLLQNRPRLKHLSVYIDNSTNDYHPTLLPTLIGLKIGISLTDDIKKIILPLQNMFNLHSLDIHLFRNIIDGYQWEDLITNYLPKLKKFRMRMKETVHSIENLPERMTKVMSSFRSSFWIDEHRWYVRCFVFFRTVYLCTLPDTFLPINILPSDFFISTDPDDNLQNFCNDITDISAAKFFDDLRLSNIRFTNIQNLKVHTPIHNQFWSIVPSLNQLHSLTVYVNVEIPQAQLQTLFDRAPNLCHLKIRADKSSCLNMSLLKHINTSFRQLDIEYSTPYFNEEECLTFARSSLGTQCEVLSINVWNSESILILIHNMITLRLLKIFCYDVARSKHSITETSAEDKLIQWLKERLPSTYLIIRPKRFPDRIRIWM